MLAAFLTLALYQTGSTGQVIAVTTAYASRASGSGPRQAPLDSVISAVESGAWKGGEAAGWKKISADAKGHFSGPYTEGGWIDATVSVPAAGAYLLDAKGDSYALINGAPRVGDVYETGHAQLPVWLNAGDNDLLFRCGRGDLQVSLSPATKAASLSVADSTLPDIHPGQKGKIWGAVLVSNASQDWAKGLTFDVHQGSRSIRTPIRPLLPMSLGKAGFELDSHGSPHLVIDLIKDGKKLDELKIDLRQRKAGETYKETFISDIDGSVQYYGVNPAWNAHPGQALALTLHGAGVEAIGQADAYSSKPWISIVAATNRRPYGYDWEDWGRLDALEVLHQAEAQLQPNPSRIYLVGHSMGGHGTILNGALYPGMFAAIAPSAGWISASTYAGMKRLDNPDSVESVLQLASYQDETRRYLNNYRAEGVFLLQGGADDNVPPHEEESLSKLLSQFHHDYEFTEVPGMGHWWDKNPEPGADCIDLAELWDFLGRHALPPQNSVHDVDFSTSNPEVSSSLYLATIEQQTAPLRLSRVILHADPFLRRIRGVTRNVRVLTLRLNTLHPGKGLEVALDGQTLKLDIPEGTKSVTLQKDGSTWKNSTVDLSKEKNPSRTGPFRLAFQHRFVFVYGTHGTTAENQAILDKVRYDAETWWYRANGSVDIVADRDFRSSSFKGRSIILYGNEDTNSAWKDLAAGSSIQVKEGSVSVFGQQKVGSDICALYWIPKPGEADTSVGFVGGTGVSGIRAADVLSYLQPMIGYPDWLLFDQAASQAGRWMTAGFYSNDWGKSDSSLGSDLAPVPLDNPNWMKPFNSLTP